jgi:WD40 repeat protein
MPAVEEANQKAATSNSYLDKIEASYQPLDFCFHPTRHNLLAAALVDGSVEIHDFATPHPNDNSKNAAFSDDEEDEVDSLLSSLSLHAQRIPTRSNSNNDTDQTNASTINDNSKHKTTTEASCKTIAFSLDGTTLFSAGSAGDLVAVDAERACTFSMDSQWQKKILWNIQPAATEGLYNPITVIRPFENNPSLFATGDDAGGIRLWDQRICKSWTGGDATAANTKSHEKQPKKKNNKKNKQHHATPRPPGCVLSWKEQEDYISAIQPSQDEQTLIATSADCRLGVYDLRMNRENTHLPSFRLSDDQEDELLSLQIMKHGKKVVCGTQEGVLSVFSWGTWGDCSDRFPGHPNSIDTLLKVDEDTLLTGSSDGHIRVVQVQPDKLLGVIGDDHEGFPIEKLGFNSNRHLVGSLTHSNFIKLWDATILMGDDDDDDDEEEEGDSDGEKGESDSDREEDIEVAAKPIKKAPSSTQHDSDDDWDDMDKEGKDDSSNGSDDIGSDDDSDSEEEEEPVTINDKRKKRLKTENERFFEDL